MSGPTIFLDDSPCDVPGPTYEQYAASYIGDGAAESYALHLQLRAMTCGDEIPVPLWKTTMTEAEVIAAIFNGYSVPPTPVPLPAGFGLLLAALVMLRGWR